MHRLGEEIPKLKVHTDRLARDAARMKEFQEKIADSPPAKKATKGKKK
jgi:hypothetical protein